MLDATFRRGTKHAYVAPPTFARVGTLRNEWSMPAVPPLFDFDPKKVEIKQKDGTTLEAMAKTRYVVKAQTRLPN